MTTTEKLPLKFGFTETPIIYITENPEDPPYSNELTFYIANPEGSRAVTFKNEKNYTPDTLDLPGLYDTDDSLSGIFISFQWGTEAKDLATEEDSEYIVCSSDDNTWYAKKMHSEDLGYYWRLFPESRTTLNKQTSLTFVFRTIISRSKSGESWAKVQSKNIEEYAEDKEYVMFYKKDQPKISSFVATPATVCKGCMSRLSWEVEYADFCILDPGNNRVPFIGHKDVTPDDTTTYILSACNNIGITKTSNVVLNVKESQINSFTANVNSPVNARDPVVLSWNTLFATTCVIEPGIGTVADSGQITVNPLDTTTYTLTCQGKNGPLIKSVTVVVNSVTIEAFTINPLSIDPGQSAELAWKVNNAFFAGIDDIGRIQLPQGTKKVSPTQDTTYTLFCNGPNGPVRATVQIQVNCVKITNLSTNCEREYTYVNWSTENATSVELIDLTSGSVLSKAPSGRKGFYTLSGDAISLELRCQGPGGPISQQVIVG